VRWSIRTEQIEQIGARLGLAPEARKRLRPDGSLLTWRAAGLELSLRDAWLPFFMQWDDPDQFPRRDSREASGRELRAVVGCRVSPTRS